MQILKQKITGSTGDYNRFRRKGRKGDPTPIMLGVWLVNHSFSGSFLIHSTLVFLYTFAEIENNKVPKRGRRRRVHLKGY